jgi:rhodanese-related sulfurtransferase
MQDIWIFLQHHWTLALPLAIVFICLMVIEFIKQAQGAKVIGPARLTYLMNRESAPVIDIRSSEQFKTNHILGSISVPLKELSTDATKLDKYKDKPIVFVCANGLDSLKISNKFVKAGMNISILNGGLRSWAEANLPLTNKD